MDTDACGSEPELTGAVIGAVRGWYVGKYDANLARIRDSPLSRIKTVQYPHLRGCNLGETTVN
jgi:hypothetical protein